MLRLFYENEKAILATESVVDDLEILFPLSAVALQTKSILNN